MSRYTRMYNSRGPHVKLAIVDGLDLQEWFFVSSVNDCKRYLNYHWEFIDIARSYTISFLLFFFSFFSFFFFAWYDEGRWNQLLPWVPDRHGAPCYDFSDFMRQTILRTFDGWHGILISTGVDGRVTISRNEDTDLFSAELFLRYIHGVSRWSDGWMSWNLPRFYVTGRNGGI